MDIHRALSIILLHLNICLCQYPHTTTPTYPQPGQHPTNAVTTSSTLNPRDFLEALNNVGVLCNYTRTIQYLEYVNIHNCLERVTEQTKHEYDLLGKTEPGNGELYYKTCNSLPQMLTCMSQVLAFINDCVENGNVLASLTTASQAFLCEDQTGATVGDLLSDSRKQCISSQRQELSTCLQGKHMPLTNNQSALYFVDYNVMGISLTSRIQPVPSIPETCTILGSTDDCAREILGKCGNINGNELTIKLYRNFGKLLNCKPAQYPAMYSSPSVSEIPLGINPFLMFACMIISAYL